MSADLSTTVPERTVVNDAVNHPSHYTRFSIEIIEVTSQLSNCLGNAVKYIARAGAKDDTKEIEDLRKARFYLVRELDDFRRGREVATASPGVLLLTAVLKDEIGGRRGIMVHNICFAAVNARQLDDHLPDVITLLDELIADLGYVDAAPAR